MTDIFVPANFTKDPRREVLACLVCGATFETDQVGRYERHIGVCSEKRGDEIEAQLDEVSVRRKMPGLFGPEAGDVEFERWMKRNAKDVFHGKLKP